ncbi:hypothetical protein GE09DRAFT_1282664 [Coniochaeta sp. 2T2.1]|nr:hypothetical protein GE09DRAFT_1291079 [Coniochaeta sp. 2T2.1]KAB5572239.1 hypothetical protein GE09DRAFT_1282664 [Coniochaeta sp. 2T2.1]
MDGSANLPDFSFLGQPDFGSYMLQQPNNSEIKTYVVFVSTALKAKDARASETERQTISQERARYEEEINRRDKFIEEISNTVLDVLDEIKRYKDATKEEPGMENITVYSKFEFDSPI